MNLWAGEVRLSADEVRSLPVLARLVISLSQGNAIARMRRLGGLAVSGCFRIVRGSRVLLKKRVSLGVAVMDQQR